MRGVGVLLALVSLSLAATQHELFNYNPVANPQAVVTAGNARFTVLTDRVIRIEWTNTSAFEDRATLAVLNRNLTVPAFTNRTNAGILTIQTKSIALHYTVGQPFSGQTLSVVVASMNNAVWTYGSNDPLNLLGTIRTLDGTGVIPLNCTQQIQEGWTDEHCEWGLISRSGYAVYDDSTNYCLDSNDWWTTPNGDVIDLYFFGHGMDYKGAIGDYIKIGGNIAMVPRYAIGIWWSRWYDINNRDMEAIVDAYQQRAMPLDVFVLDMDWHLKYDWTGYTFDFHLFPYPADTMGLIHDQGLAMTANLHDADGVGTFEAMHDAYCTSLGMTNCGTIPMNIVNSTWAYNLEDVVLKPLEDMGMDFWWIDWQQGDKAGGTAGGKQNPTIWLSHLRCTDKFRRGQNQRAMVLARWGGMGNHRYQVGFSGDVAGLTWPNFAFQPYFSYTASNVGFGFWSHDIIGPANDNELHTRWIQWAAFSGVFRTHDRGMSAGGCNDDTPPDCPIVAPWNVPTAFEVLNRAAMLRRVGLAPYIYTMWRHAFDSGISILRPMYYEFPTFNNAYLGDRFGNFPQYFFGDDMFVSPVVVQMNTTTQMATQPVWIPPGDWYEYDTGAIHTGATDGSTILTKGYDISEIPVFIRAGAIIPTIPLVEGQTIGRVAQQYTSLVFSIYPGGPGSGSTKVYEDDGVSMDYIQSQYVWTTASYTRSASGLTFTVSSAGSFAGFPQTRAVTLKVITAFPATAVTVNGAPISWARKASPDAWSYCGKELALVVTLAPRSTSQTLTIAVSYIGSTAETVLEGVRGAMNHATLAKLNLDETRSTPGAQTPSGGRLMTVSSTTQTLGYLAGTNQSAFMSTVTGFPNAYQLAVTEINSMGPPPPNAMLWLWDAARGDNCLCGVQGCIDDNNYYQTIKVECFMPADHTAPGVIPLNGFWAQEWNDNYADTRTDIPTGYVMSNFVPDGWVYKSQQPNTVPLAVYFSDKGRHDYLTVCSPQGHAYAKANSYQLVNPQIGWVYLNDPVTGLSSDFFGVSFGRWSYSVALLETGFS